MNTRDQGTSISRRRFLKGFGSGVIGGSLVLGGVAGAVPAANDDVREFLEGAEPLTLTVNGQTHRVLVESRTSLAALLRHHLGLTGTKIVCGRGECGGCTVIMEGKAIYSCHTLALDAAGKEVLTVEGLLSGEDLHPVQSAFVDEDGLQCGFCTPGQIVAAYALLQEHPSPSGEQIQVGLSGNLCRCAAYPNIYKSVRTAAGRMNSNS